MPEQETSEKLEARGPAFGPALGSADWEASRFKGGRKWVCWGIGAWVTQRKNQPLHVGLSGRYLGTWTIEPEVAMARLEEMHRKILNSN